MLSILKRSLKLWLSMFTSFSSNLFKILLIPCSICAIYVDLYLRFSSFYKKSQQEQQEQQEQQQQQQQLLNL